MLKLVYGPEKCTHPLVWIAAFFVTIFALGVIVAGIVVFVGYLVIHPRIPFIIVSPAHLDLLRYDLSGLLQTQVTILVRAENDNQKAHATFSDIHFNLTFQGLTIAKLVSPPFDVSKNDTFDLNYVVLSLMVPLRPEQMVGVDLLALKRNEIRFDLMGSSRPKWRVGPLVKLLEGSPMRAGLPKLGSGRGGVRAKGRSLKEERTLRERSRRGSKGANLFI